MTTDPDNTPEKPENAAEGLPEEPKQRFDPFTNEGDMFKIVLGVGGWGASGCAAGCDCRGDLLAEPVASGLPC